MPVRFETQAGTAADGKPVVQLTAVMPWQKVTLLRAADEQYKGRVHVYVSIFAFFLGVRELHRNASRELLAKGSLLALKALLMRAWGIAPGLRKPYKPALKARFNRSR